MKLANDKYIQKKYELALETYKNADKQIALFHKQALIDSYSKELQAGMKRVTEGISSMSQVYQNQLVKANENFNKGPQFYGTAKSILNSDPMKSRQNEPSVIELKNKIIKMETYYAQRKAAYLTVKSKNNAQALKDLKAIMPDKSFSRLKLYHISLHSSNESSLGWSSLNSSKIILR
jgi:hypothetical protein